MKGFNRAVLTLLILAAFIAVGLCCGAFVFA